MFKVNPRVQGVSPELLSLYAQASPSQIGHMTDFGFIKGLEPASRPVHFLGNAVTVKIPSLDSAALHLALDVAQPGDVLCVDTNGNLDRACWGEIVTHMALHKKIAGAVIDGAITDYQAIVKYGFPVFSRGVSALTTRIMGLEGAVNVPVSLCGVTVEPGYLIVADDDGVFAIKPEDAENFGKRAQALTAKEVEMKRQIDEGVPLSEISGAARFGS